MLGTRTAGGFSNHPSQGVPHRTFWSCQQGGAPLPPVDWGARAKFIHGASTERLTLGVKAVGILVLVDPCAGNATAPTLDGVRVASVLHCVKIPISIAWCCVVCVSIITDTVY